MSKWLEKQKMLEAEAEAEAVQNTAADMDAEERDPVSGDTADTALESLYTWVKYDNIYSVARRLGFGVEELLEHNDISDPATIKPGDTLHLPIPRDLKKQETFTVEVLDEPIQMHIVKYGGCKKWGFAGMNKWSDAVSAGFFPENANITILAIAHVPVEEDDGSKSEAAYYIDAVSLGDYTTSGMLKWATGFIWQDLAEGKYMPPAPAQVAQAALAHQKAMEVELEEKSLLSAQEEARDTLVDKKIDDMEEGIMPNDFKTTLQVVQPPVSCLIDIPTGIGEYDSKVGERYIRVHDFEGNRPFKRLFNGQVIRISSFFEFDGALYGRPDAAAKNGLWYGVPAEALLREDELYNTGIDAESRAAIGGRLTWAERYVWVPLAKTMNRHPFKGLK